MRTLGIDIETYSETDLVKSGVYKYVQDPTFTILLFAYRFDKDSVQVIDLTKEQLPDNILEALIDPDIEKTAFNANFERTCISRYLGINLPIEQWKCTSVHASMLGLPLNLEAVARILKLEAQKSAAGKALIKYFTMPCKPTKANAQRTRNLPEHDPEKWNQFIDYCRQDVVVEQAIAEKIAFFKIPEAEKKLWQIDQLINDHGVLLDPVLVRNAIAIGNTHQEKLAAEAIELTGLNNPNSAAQLKQWLSKESGTEVTSLTKEAVPILLEKTDCEVVKRVLGIRSEMAKTSTKKYAAMTKAICPDLRVRGLLQFYGANRTGRWAGRLVQVQNLPKNHMKDLHLARSVVRSGDLDLLQMLYGNVPDTLSQLVRTAFVASEGSRLMIADFSAIEARVIAWLAGEKWRLDVFNTHGKIYEASAAHMFKVPIEAVTKESVYRQRGKVSELALGYQGGPGALIAMGALKMGIPEEELPKLVAMWRQENKAIVKYWNTVEEAAVECVSTGVATTVNPGITFSVSKNVLFITLPSGRKLSYLQPHLVSNRFGGHSLCYLGMNQTTKQWGRQDTYGGKLVENLCQAIARDCLADAMIRLHDKGYKIAMHVHDEIVADMPNGQGSLEEINHIMSQPIPWAKGLPLRVDSYETQYYYKKD